jgi:hypothetical protein
MAETGIPTDVQDVTHHWMRIANALARGQLAPEDGVARLRTLAEEYPEDREWLDEEIEIIRRQFALDVIESVQGGQGSYWEKLRLVIQALLSERLDHDRALELLKSIDAGYPEHAAHTAKLIEGISQSPLRRYLEKDN